jgi:hypothetical protein
MVFLTLILSSSLVAQETKAAHPPVSPNARLMAAKTAYVKNGGGSDIPYNVIEGGMEGWPRLLLVDSPEKADIVVEITSTEDNTDVSVTSSTDAGGHTATKASRELSVGSIKMLVYDPRTHLPLWTSTEKPKGAFKDRNRQDNIVESAEKLLARFRERMEPLPSK